MSSLLEQAVVDDDVCTKFSQVMIPRLLRPTTVTITAAGPWRAACRRPLVTQQALFADERSKQQVLANLLHCEKCDKGLSVVFVSTRRLCEMLHFFLLEEGFQVGKNYFESTGLVEQEDEVGRKR